MIKYAVENHTHPSFVHLLHKPCKQLVARFKIADIACSLLIFCSACIIFRSFRKRLSAVRDDLSIMWIDIIIILNVIFMI